MKIMIKMSFLIPCFRILVLTGLSIAGVSCFRSNTDAETQLRKGTYGYDAEFLRSHLKEVTELRNQEGARVLVTGDYQGRVMTSTASADSGNSFGWINYDLIGRSEPLQQFNPVGGEERFWVGPEGGQFSFYFKKDVPFDFQNWQVPSFIDTEPYTVVSSRADHVSYTHRAALENYSGARFEVEISRSVNLLNRTMMQERLGQPVPDALKWVAYETVNEVENTGANEWKKDTGLLSVWLLGMFTPSEETVAIIPFKSLENSREYITDNYFGEIPEDRLTVKDSVLLLKCDGRHRSKLGLSPVIAKPIAGSYDFQKNVLTFILFDVDTAGIYVNSKWEVQDRPFSGDAVNAYNDGPLQDGSQMGPFYELESSSSAKPLKPGERLVYKQVTCHIEGDYHLLDGLARVLLGIGLDDARMR